MTSEDAKSTSDLELDLELRFFDGADDQLVDIARRYWSFDGVDESGAYPQWGCLVRDIDTAGWGRRLHVLAAAVSRAVLKGFSCAACGGELSLASRSTLQEVLDGAHEHDCVDCRPVLLEEAEKLSDPKRRARRQQHQERQLALQRVASAKQEWLHNRREAAYETYPLRWRPEEQVPPLSLYQELTALAVLRYAAKGGLVCAQARLTDRALVPHVEDFEALNELHNLGVLAIHPGTPLDSLVWEPATFQEAYAQAEGNLDNLPAARPAGRYWPFKTVFYVPFGSDASLAAKRLDKELTQRLARALKDHERYQALEELAVEVIAAETVRYFDYKLTQHHLPAVPGDHRPRLEEAAVRLARSRCLGDMYFCAWSAASSAATASKRHPSAPQENMTTHGVNRFEDRAKTLLDNPGEEVKTFEEDANFGLSALTRTLFYTVLDMNPMTTTLSQIRQQRPAPPTPPSPPRVAQPSTAPSAEDSKWTYPPLEESEFPSVELQARRLAEVAAHWSPEKVASGFEDVRQTITAVWEDGHPDRSTLIDAAAGLETYFHQLRSYLDSHQAALAMILAGGLRRELIGQCPDTFYAGQIVIGLLGDSLTPALDMDGSPPVS
ncbi:hypothetical protein NI17_024110 (plasmid) [Thermobifida halotolerans]|uniref:Uncharacterized protein n=1 Tax=Thermobifida halotolerans TaxID=483545 RepID=A0AA97M1K1_9ACTN|nr:hypothetical protein [Thermobifida halotolerans]UOE22252.1 hypothetical protein NI17_024110 [Thermobifida halotolerans]